MKGERVDIRDKTMVAGKPSLTPYVVSDFKKLQVWQKAHALALNAHRVATRIRRTHDVALRSQIIRAAMSIPANIVEGRRQDSEKEFARFLRIALNSGCELEYHVIVARDIGVMSESDSESLLREVIEVRKMIHGLLNKIGDGARSAQSASPRSPV
ncbi:MAG: four helix bundle protein [Gemmatimonadota bacterium]|nr:four helix bundle protein [Gemmatimonadota bacterium]